MGIGDSSGKKQKEKDDLLDRQKKILNDDNDISIQNLTDHIVEENTNISEPEVEIKNNNNDQKPAPHVYNPKNLESVKYDPNLFKSCQSNFGESSQVEIFYKGQRLNYSNVINEKNININHLFLVCRKYHHLRKIFNIILFCFLKINRHK